MSKYPYLKSLDEHDLIVLYAEARKELRARGRLNLTDKTIHNLIQNKKQTFTFQRTKSGRASHMSILIDFMKEDWKPLFNGDYDNEPKYYVYYHSDPSKANMRFSKNGESITFNGRPFYVGKGKGNRYKSKKRNRSHLSVINTIVASGYTEKDMFHIFKEKLTEIEALELEAKLITFFGCSSEVSQKKAHLTGLKGGMLINSDPAIRPDCVNKMIKVKGT